MLDVVGVGAGAAGAVVPLEPGDTFAARFAEAVALRLTGTELREREAAVARARVEERFSITRAFADTIKVYDGCLAGR